MVGHGACAHRGGQCAGGAGGKRRARLLLAPGAPYARARGRARSRARTHPHARARPRAQGRWGEAAQKLSELLNDDTFRSLEGKSKHRMWLELCDMVTKHPRDVQGIRVDAILRGGIRKFTDEVRAPCARVGCVCGGGG